MKEIVFYSAIAIIAALLATAAYYQWRLYQLRKRLQVQHALADEAERKHRSDLNSSMQIICRALVAGQVGSVEASIRLSALMDQLGLSEAQRQEYTVFDKMAQAVAHIPILDAWKKLPKEKKRGFEYEMQQHEEELNDFVIDAAKRMIGQTW